MLFSLSVTPSAYSLNNLMQDSNTWVKRGIVDFLHPQLYRTRFSLYKNEIDKIQANFPNASERRKYAPGIAFRANGVNWSAEDIAKCVQLNRNRGLSGESFFFFEGLKKNNNLIAKALRDKAGYGEVAALPDPIIVT